MNWLTLFCPAVAEHYAADPSGPGVLFAVLPDGSWYVSLNRFTEKFGKGKQVVTKARAKTLDDALAGVMLEWFASVSGEPYPEGGAVHRLEVAINEAKARAT